MSSNPQAWSWAEPIQLDSNDTVTQFPLQTASQTAAHGTFRRVDLRTVHLTTFIILPLFYVPARLRDCTWPRHSVSKAKKKSRAALFSFSGSMFALQVSHFKLQLPALTDLPALTQKQRQESTQVGKIMKEISKGPSNDA